MKFILQKNVQSLIYIIQKICFYYEYNDKYKFTFKNGDLFYTNVIEIEGNEKFQYISLLSSPLHLKNNSIEAEKTIVYYKIKRNIQNSDKLVKTYHEKYNEFIHYVFNSSKDIGITSQELMEKIKRGEELLHHPLVKEIQVLFNNELEDPLREQKLKQIITESGPNAEQTLWILFHGLFITVDKVIEKYPVCYKYYSFSPTIIDLLGLGGKLFFRFSDKYFADRLSKGTVFFNHPKFFNDPFDINCFKDANGNIDKNAPERNSVRVFCSTKQYDNILLWSHYGANHTGYCIEYSTESIISCIHSALPNANVFVGNVLYDDRRKVFYSGKSNLSALIKTSFKKSKAWEYENEFRFVIYDFNGFKNLGFSDKGIPLSKAEIKNIYLGNDIKASDELYVYSCMKKIIQVPYQIFVKKMRLDNNKYKLL